MRNRAGSLCNQLCFVVENIYQVLLHFLILLKVTQKELHVGELIYLLHPTIQIVKFYLLLSSPCTSAVAYATEVFQINPPTHRGNSL